jgi:hypothetical protein
MTGMRRTWLALGAAVALVGAPACDRRDRAEPSAKPSSADEQIESSQREAEKAYDEAEKKQKEARKQQAQATNAQEDVTEQERDLAEARQKAEKERQEAEQAQQAAKQQADQAHSTASQSHQRETEARSESAKEWEAKRKAEQAKAPAPAAPAEQPKTAEPAEQPMAQAEQSEKTVTGKVTHVADDSITVEPAGQAPVTLHVDQSTSIVIDGAAKGVTAITQGSEVRATYKKSGDHSMATRIEETERQPVSGQE